jgi:hypothetical protein
MSLPSYADDDDDAAIVVVDRDMMLLLSWRNIWSNLDETA